ncbi:fibronectin type III domain-containing protein [Paenibacillus flagellatus]|uniref:Fibronectin type-III domain-containing protein n=1 Tax=Paenibacillus flagellatus TaxID=2211139 RepID=A0A2V5KDE0_9BACL|nr:fibronectin type III domain-containing protein [Paenibacillus flagellatus]PYI56184.1 hypothetical protein DLM86_04130 [Paenibacillus flagellatus]
MRGNARGRLGAGVRRLAAAAVAVLLWTAVSGESEAAATNTMTYLDNGTIRLGVDVTWGGSISYLAESGGGGNLVNRHDAGRLIQQSYYGAGLYAGCRWGANPVQGGDIRNNPSGILSYFNDNSTVYVKSRPLDWCLSDVPANAYMENWYTLEGNAVKVVNRFHNFDPGFGTIRDQELPAIFTLESLSSYTRYSGGAPFTGDTVTTSTPGFPNETHYQSEAWGTHLDATGKGIGWYTPNVHYSTNYVYTGAGTGGEYGDKVSYTAPVYRYVVLPDETYQYEYYLVVGTAAETRQLAVAKQVRTASAWDFSADGDREGWSLTAAVDGTGPTGGVWRLTPPAQTAFSIVSPPVTIPASQHLLEIKLDNDTGATSLELSWQRSGYQEPNRTQHSGSAAIPIQSNGVMTTYTYDLSTEPDWAGLIQSLKLTVNGNAASRFDIDSIRIVGGGGSAPVVTNRVATAMSPELARIAFDTDVGATATVEYGPTTAYGMHTPDNINLQTGHTVYLSGLTPGETIHYRIRTRDRDGNETITPDGTLTMPNVPLYAKQWNFDTNGDNEGWIPQRQLSGSSVSGGVLALVSSGSEPKALSPNSLGVSAADYRYVKIRLKNGTAGTTGTLYFQTDADSAWSAQKSVSFEMAPNAEGFAEYTVDMGANPAWQGTIKRLRYDPAAAPGTVSVDYIRIGRIGATDTIPPARVTDLAVTGSTGSSVALSWTAKKDGPGSGAAAFYDIRYSTSPITDGNWASATQAQGEPSPGPAGTVQSYQVTGLSPGVLYYFALRSVDAGGNVSALSNAASWASPGNAVRDWAFDTDGDFEGWIMHNHLSGSTVSGGALHLVSSGNDPYMLSPDSLGVTAAVYDKVRIRLKNNTAATTAQLFFITDADGVWNAAKSVTFTITPNDAFYKEYTVGMSANPLWTGTVRQLRFDPFGVTGTMDVDSLQLTD